MNKDLYKDLFTEKEKTVNYRDIIFEYLLYWPAILICLLVALGCAYIYLRYQTPVHNIRSTVLIKQGDKTKPSSSIQMAAMEDLGTFSMANNFDNEVEILQAFTLVKK